jgi:hypothetical protein
MVMIGFKGCRDLIAVEKLGGDASVLAKHIVGARQGGKGAQSDVGEVADRGGNEVETRRRSRGLESAGRDVKGRRRA